jgi:uncharacterized membrane protein HdeD (DUF308 family)
MDNGNSWWWTLIQGIIAIALGLYLLLGGDPAAGNFALVAGAYVLIASIIELLRGSGSFSRYRGVIGLIVGVLILLLRFVDIFSTSLDFTIFAIGVIIVGAMGLYGSFFARSGRQFEWGPVIINALLLLWGVFIFFFRAQDRDLQALSGWILIAIGAVLAIWGYFNRNASEEEVAPEPIVPKPMPPVDITDSDEGEASESSSTDI